jgi:predicted O-methyltransferase YrrM
VSTNPKEDQAFLTQPDTAYLSKAEITAWENGKTFSSDWAAHFFFTWAELLHPLRNRPVRMVEIGSWEGRSALFFVNYLTRAHIVCIDPFEGNVEHHREPYWKELATRSEAQFDANLAGFHGRVEKIKGASTIVLPELAIEGRRFDLAYIDGSHMAADVYRDAVLTWSLIDPGGTVIFDDYGWEMMETERERPKLGIDRFLSAHEGEYIELHRGFQIAIQKV